MLLRRPHNAPDFPRRPSSASGASAWPYHARLRTAAHIVTNGPVTEQPDPSLRGLMFYRTASLQQARRLADDPAVRSRYVAGGTAPDRAFPAIIREPGCL